MSEAKDYAARNRQGSDWFGHSAAPAASPVASASKPDTPSSVTKKSETSEATTGRTQMIKPSSDSNQWYKYEATKTSPAEPLVPAVTVQQKAEPVKSSDTTDGGATTGRQQMIKPTSDSNQWYKYDNAANGKDAASAPQEPAHRKPAPANVSNEKAHAGDWYSHDTKAADTTSSADGGKSSPVGRGGRSKQSAPSADWFTHDHTDAGTGSCASPRITTKEGGENATRMRGESENWFNHDANKDAANNPIHVSKGRATSRQQNSEMNQIFGGK